MGLDNEFDSARSALQGAEKDAAAKRRILRTAELRLAATPDDEGLKHLVAQLRESSQAANNICAKAFRDFDVFADPQRGLLAEPVPLLLMPIRVETRFKGAELLVRIYPDECSVDSFDPELNEEEVGSAAQFLREYWRAGGVETEERAAFRTVAGDYGAGRAKWLATNYVANNAANRPVTKNPHTDVILVISDSGLPTDVEQTALTAYWKAVWVADDDRAATVAARTTLDQAVGGPGTAGALIGRYAPFNLTDPPPPGVKRADTNLTVAWLDLPDTVGEPHIGWRRAPLAAMMPERFAVVLYSGGSSRVVSGKPVAEPLYVGPDPAAPDSDRITPLDPGKLKIPDQLKWVFEFTAAENAGMGIRVQLTRQERADGFDRVIVVGLRMRSDPLTAKAEFEELLKGHNYSRAGLELLPQGVPTNNSDNAPTPWSKRDDADLAYDDVFGPVKFTSSSDPHLQLDGDVLARQLGIDPTVVQRVRGADGRDAIEARAMNTALAPGTIRYLTGVLMHPVFKGWVDELTTFYCNYVTGRGPVSGLRIGTQPYGVLLSTAFSRIAWTAPPSAPAPAGDAVGSVNRQQQFLSKLHSVLGALEKFWADAARTVAHVGSGADPHETLLDVLGLHPGSAEFHTRRAKTLDELSSRWNLFRFLGLPSEKYRALAQRKQALDLLRSLGYAGEEPDLLDMFFWSAQSELKGPLIEDIPLSESSPLAAATSDGRNYLQWLGDAANQSVDVLRRQEGFVGDSPPRTLLFLMLQFALTRGYDDAGNRLRFLSGLFSDSQISTFTREAKSVHVNVSAAGSDSPWRRLYDADRRLTGSPTLSVADHLTSVLRTPPSYAAGLAEQIRAVETLAKTPTARLERAFVEHIDTLCYRYDAWRLGMVRWQLDVLRTLARPAAGVAPADRSSTIGPRKGLYVGAYGWVENLRPKKGQLSPPDPPLPDELKEAFKEGPQLQQDPNNGGHLHAPSMNQGVTAAILRAGSLANKTPGVPDAFSINLASARVRTAANLLEGVRSGQNLGALLGYRFERALHDAGGVLELDSLIFTFRRAFPLAADKLKPTQSPTPPASEAIEARNVVDGIALVKAAQPPSEKYTKLLEGLGAAEAQLVTDAVADLAAAFDAMADLLLAESVHQASQSNPERATNPLDISADFTAPAVPRVVETPSTGIALTCRVGLELDPSATAPNGPPRAKAQPAVDKWLTQALPPLNTIGCTVKWMVGTTEHEKLVRLSDLGLAPIDVIYLIADEGGAGFGELDDRIRRHVIESPNPPRPDTVLNFDYMTGADNELSVFVASAFVKRQRGITLNARPLRASDVVVPGKADGPDAIAHVVDRARVADVHAALINVRGRIETAIADGETLAGNKPQLLSGIDTRIAKVVELLAEVAMFGGKHTGWGSLYDWRSTRFAELIAKVDGLLTSWAERLKVARKALDDELALPNTATDAERIALLRAAEGQVSTAVAAETTPDTLRPVVTSRVDAFKMMADNIRANAIDPPNPSLADRLSRCQAISVAQFDPNPPSFTEDEEAIVSYWVDLQRVLTTTRDDVMTREQAAKDGLAAHDDPTADAAGKLAALQRAAEGVFGEGFRLVPSFTLDAQNGAEQTNANNYFSNGGLLSHAKTVLGVPNPLDTWLYGCARVRPNLKLLEEAIMLTEAHGRNVGALHAMQLPHKNGAAWLALDFPPEDTPDGERLAYVAVGPTTFDPAARRCGLLVDDWAETIPVIEDKDAGPQHTTGLAFHFDRPSQEPPQAMLMLTPATWNGAWAWDDIVAGIVDTFELARLRAVEPADLDSTALAQFLPATVASVTTSGLLLAANYSLLNLVPTIIRSAGDG
ncbi:hypothetical protein [Mycolicibacterium porcinum]|uniref:hypothetical protein n=1 Tax=Mycolicibacterium porcinum TaxID=39693 RepID=UPI000848CC32|nr:hypothetical protein [Mycolicibacterium porcinum]ODR25780.1 hypothetical protein BHQ19_10400 [Mycolicibacterium porcinum]